MKKVGKGRETAAIEILAKKFWQILKFLASLMLLTSDEPNPTSSIIKFLFPVQNFDQLPSDFIFLKFQFDTIVFNLTFKSLSHGISFPITVVGNLFGDHKFNFLPRFTKIDFIFIKMIIFIFRRTLSFILFHKELIETFVILKYVCICIS